MFTDLQSVGFPHSDTRGSIGRLHLPAHFRSLPRPSSSPGAKASPMRPYSLPTLAWPYRPSNIIKHPFQPPKLTQRRYGLLVWLNYLNLSTSIPSSLVNELLS